MKTGKKTFFLIGILYISALCFYYALDGNPREDWVKTCAYVAFILMSIIAFIETFWASFPGVEGEKKTLYLFGIPYAFILCFYLLWKGTIGVDLVKTCAFVAAVGMGSFILVKLLELSCRK